MFKVGDKVRRKAEMQNGWWTVGDRVLVVRKIGANASMKLDHIAQPGCYSETSWWDMDKFDFVAPAAKARPQAGEYWRQRDGKVVGPLKVDERSGVFVLHEGALSIPQYWLPTGAEAIVNSLSTESNMDLIEKIEVCAHCGQPIAKVV